MMPVLPPELEREIFEVAAGLDFNTIPSLLRVARHVLEWVEPFLYRVVVINDSAKAEAYHLTLLLKPHLLANNLQHLFLAGFTCFSRWPEKDVHVLLQLCAPRLLSLAVFAPLQQQRLIPSFSHITQLRRWAGILEDFDFASRGYSAKRILPAFLTVTHMDIFDYFTDENEEVICAGLEALPCLTHLCLSGSPLTETLGLIPRILAQCVHLRVLVLKKRPREEIAGDLPTVDVRFVISTRDSKNEIDWEVGARGGTDFWAAADEFVARKRRGEIQASCYLLDHFQR
ncbi:hypothetical protein C8R45DRAFT_377588 [Mycena sanguinolenta]|nr:hypothetical protein C8R45DRAFT_377588 [Mycena sanguinolenta]